MRCTNKGDYFTVSFNSREIEEFAKSWPCSGLRIRSVWFEFARGNGDLVASNEERQQPHASPDALVAMASVARVYGIKRLRLVHLDYLLVGA